jgi:hypothetical protein
MCAEYDSNDKLKSEMNRYHNCGLHHYFHNQYIGNLIDERYIFRSNDEVEPNEEWH